MFLNFLPSIEMFQTFISSALQWQCKIVCVEVLFDTLGDLHSALHLGRNDSMAHFRDNELEFLACKNALMDCMSGFHLQIKTAPFSFQ